MRSNTILTVIALAGCSDEMLDPMDPDSFRQYSATVTVDAMGSKNVFDYQRDGTKLLVAPRLSGSSLYDQRATILIDMETKDTTTVSWGQKRYYVGKLNEKQGGTAMSWLGSGPGAKVTVASREILSAENVDGHDCSVQRLRLQMPDGAIRHVKLWCARDLRGFAVRVEATDGPLPATIGFSNVKLGPPSGVASFQLPSDFKLGN